MSQFDPAPAAAALLDARRHRRWLDSLPGAAPADDAEAYAVQDRVAAALGPVVAWKVGAPAPEATPFRAPIHADTFFEGDRIPADILHLIGVEAELAYRFARDLSPRDAPYAAAEVLDAVGSLHPAIEIVDTRFAKLGIAGPFSHKADQGSHGALAIGPAVADWRDVVPVRQPVRLELDGAVAHAGVGGNSAGDPVRMLVWLANQGARSLGGIRAGQVVTTGSTSGTIFVAPGTAVRAEFPGFGGIALRID